MSGIIHFGSGKTLEISEYEFSKMAPKLGAKGIRSQITEAGHIVPLNSTTMEFIEKVAEPTLEAGVTLLDKDETIIGEIQSQEVIPKTNSEILDIMKEKSNCKHEPEKQSLYVQHTAKGKRYFPVCDFCGKRERYISEKKIADKAYVGTPNEKWTLDDIKTAKSWIED